MTFERAMEAIVRDCFASTRVFTGVCCRRDWKQARLGVHFSVSTKPLTNHFCIAITTIAGGIMANMAVAITMFHSVCASPPEEIICLMPSTTGYMFSLVVISRGHRYWFHP